MSPLARSLAVLLAFGFVACGRKLVNDDGGASGATASGRGGSAAGANGGAAAGATGGSTAGASGGSTAGGNGGTIAGAGAGGANGGSSGRGGSLGTGGSGIAGATGQAGRGGTTGTAGSGGGASAGSGGATAGTSGSGLGPLRLVIFYTRWGTSYPEWWPTGADRDFTMSAMLQALEPRKRDIILVSGLTNANLYLSGAGADWMIYGASANDMGDAMITLLTGRPAVAGHPADGPSLDTVIGDCGGAAGPPLRLAVGQFGYDDNPGISFGADGVAIRGEADPHAAAMRVLGHDVTAPDPAGDIDTDYPALGAAQMDVAAEALAKSKACVVTLMWGDRVIPKSLGLTQDIHTLSHDTADLYSAITSTTPPRPGNRFATLQRWYAQQFASLLDRLAAIPLGGETLLDQSVVVWLSESGAGGDHQGLYMPVVIAGRGGGRLDVGRFIEVKPHVKPPGQFPDYWAIERTQGDLLLALAGLWSINGFGDPRIARQAFSDILKP